MSMGVYDEVACPDCTAPVKQPCLKRSGKPADAPHRGRVRAYDLAVASRAAVMKAGGRGTHQDDEDLLSFRLGEALRWLEHSEELIPENTKRWRFLMAAQLAVKAVREVDDADD